MQTKEEKAAWQKQYYQDNKEALTAKQKKYDEDHKEQIVARKKQYNEDNREAILAQQKQYYKDNREAMTAQQKQWREDNKEAIAVRRKAKLDARNLEIFEYKGGACAHCSSRELDYLGMYEYHHVDPTTKMYSVGTIITGPMDRVYTEVDKCLLLCPNCHRKEHINLNKAKL
jgi:hypothetical protein